MKSEILLYLTNEQLRKLADWRWGHEQATLVDDQIKCRGCDGCGRQNVGQQDPSNKCGYCKGTGKVANPAKKVPSDTIEFKLGGQGVVLQAKVDKVHGQVVFRYDIESQAMAREMVYRSFTVDLATREVTEGIKIQRMGHGQRQFRLMGKGYPTPWIDLRELVYHGAEEEVYSYLLIFPRPDCQSLTKIVMGNQLNGQLRNSETRGAILVVRNLHRLTGERVWTEGPLICRDGPGGHRDTRNHMCWDWDELPSGVRLLAIEEEQDKVFRNPTGNQLGDLTNVSLYGGNIYSPEFALLTLEAGSEIHAHYAKRSTEVPYPVVRVKWDGKELTITDFIHPTDHLITLSGDRVANPPERKAK